MGSHDFHFSLSLQFFFYFTNIVGDYIGPETLWKYADLADIYKIQLYNVDPLSSSKQEKLIRKWGHQGRMFWKLKYMFWPWEESQL